VFQEIGFAPRCAELHDFAAKNFADRRKDREKRIPSRMRVEWSDALLSFRSLGRTTGFAFACFLAMMFSGRLFG
jgi:hypothetical protein